ncbi:MAG: OmcA/MtrC family decaheme c-type cytochrome [Acidobacteria bacterium]|nr:OmcA/MtrC family decaheme c-type cytochrome [Acidobacteriota bacterium]
MKIKGRFQIWVVGSVMVLGFLSVFLAARLEVDQQYGPLDKEFYLSDTQVQFIRPGLEFQILEVTIGADRKPVVKISLKDPKGLPLDRDGIFTPGPISTTFVIGYIPANATQYTNYNIRNVASTITGKTATQATSDSGGKWAKVEDGVYTYTFGNALPAGFDGSLTHTIAAYARRDLTEFNLDRYVKNAVFHWVPNGGEVKQWRDVVRTANCNECHNPLALHGGARQEVGLCILCHQPQTSDPDTGNTVDFKVMIHKIHMGPNLPSAKAGKPYQIIGNQGRVFNFSEHVLFPQDIRNCEKCHKNATQGLAYLLKPSAAACGSCHDDVNFATGVGHPGGPQASDNLCATCHIPEGELEFDASIKGAHKIPAKSAELKGLQLKILGVSNTAPGQSPTVLFTVTEKDGTAVAPSSLNFLQLVLSGPTKDYENLIIEPARDAVPTADGYTYTFKGKIPENAKGSFMVGGEAYRMVTLAAGTTKERQVRETANNPVQYVAVTDANAVPRRQVVATANCNRCHDEMVMHGTIRHDPEKYCVVCHIPSGTDAARRPADQMPPQSRDFRFMVHRIHTGADLTREFSIYGFGGALEANEINFPGDRRDCEKCHVNNSYRLPLASGLQPVPVQREFFTPYPPTTAACLGCHDGEAAAAHAYTMITPFGEACAACHGTGREFAVERVHAR